MECSWHTPEMRTKQSQVPGKTSIEIKTRLEPSTSTALSDIPTGREHLSDTIFPHELYESLYRYDPNTTWEAADETSIVRKTDLHLLLCLCLMIFGTELDRGNLPNALADNFLGDLDINTNDYNNGWTIQQVCMIATTFPVQAFAKRFGCRYVLPVMMICWSTVSWAQAWITGRTSFFITRALLGACEGGFIPGLVLFTTYFYKSTELPMRLTFFWSSINIGRLVSSPMAAGILKMRGVCGKPGWFWLFTIQGLFTFIISIFSLLYLPLSPTRTTSFLWRRSWYSPREETIMINRIIRDDAAKGLTGIFEPLSLQDLFNNFSDTSMWGLYLIGLVAYIPAVPIQAYLPLILRKVGYSTLDSNILAIPSIALQIVLMFLLAKSSNYFDERTWHCFIGELWLLPPLAALIALPKNADSNVTRVVLSSLVGGYPCFHPIVTSWISENSFDVKKRALTAATYNVCVQASLIISSQLYREDDAPYYPRGNSVLISLSALALTILVIQNLYLKHMNRTNTRAWTQMAREEQVEYQRALMVREKEGNRRLDFTFKY